MAENNQPPTPEADDDLLNWMPPELIERAREYAQRDANTNPIKGKKKRIDYAVPPKGNHWALSLATLAGGALLLVIGTFLQGTGSLALKALEDKGDLWFSLWLAGQAGTLCVYLLCLLPLDKKLRRAALVLALSVSLAFGLAASVTTMRPGDSESISPTAQLVVILFSLLIALAFHANTWLLLGVLRRKTTEKFSALMGGITLAISLLGLLAGLSETGALVTALGIAQGLCFLCLIATWPVLDRALLPKGETDGQPE